MGPAGSSKPSPRACRGPRLLVSGRAASTACWQRREPTAHAATTTDICPWTLRGRLTRISASCPSAVRKSINRSTERLPDRVRTALVMSLAVAGHSVCHANHPATRSATRKLRGSDGWGRTGTDAQSANSLNESRVLARPAGLEPATPGLEGGSSDRMSAGVPPLPKESDQRAMADRGTSVECAPDSARRPRWRGRVFGQHGVPDSRYTVAVLLS
jgi:hypothetical protein